MTSQRMKGLYWGIAVLLTAALASVAWAQILSAVSNCFHCF
jgi:hypothetical protein